MSNREWEVLQLLLQGKSNKLIAASLDISVRIIEFHLKNIYAKFQVSARIELILKLENATGALETQKPGYSTVAGQGDFAENRDKLDSRMNWAASFTEAVSIIGKELKMKQEVSLKLAFVGVIGALLAGLFWNVVWEYAPGELFIPLIVVLVISGLVIGMVGKQRGEAPLKVLFSFILGAGLSPLVVIPFMTLVVLPAYIIARILGVFDLSAMSTETVINLEMGTLLVLLLIASIAVAISMLTKVMGNRQVQSA